MGEKYNVPSDQALAEAIAKRKKQREAIDREIKLFEAMLQLNEEGRMLAMLNLFELTLYKKYTEH